jgi:hypothetical protein
MIKRDPDAMEIMVQDYVSLFPAQDLTQNALFIGMKTVVSDVAVHLGKKVEVFHPEFHRMFSATESSVTSQVWNRLPGETPTEKRAHHTGNLYKGKFMNRSII